MRWPPLSTASLRVYGTAAENCPDVSGAGNPTERTVKTMPPERSLGSSRKAWLLSCRRLIEELVLEMTVLSRSSWAY